MTDGRLRRPSVRKFARRTMHVALIFMAALFASALILFGFLLVMSPETPKPFVDDSGKPLAGGISQKIRLNIGGVEQGMFITGRNVRNPVLLYLHGGVPDYFFTACTTIRCPTRSPSPTTSGWMRR